jgi:hypothetical protein
VFLTQEFNAKVDVVMKQETATRNDCEEINACLLWESVLEEKMSTHVSEN